MAATKQKPPSWRVTSRTERKAEGCIYHRPLGTIIVVRCTGADGPVWPFSRCLACRSWPPKRMRPRRVRPARYRLRHVPTMRMLLPTPIEPLLNGGVIRYCRCARFRRLSISARSAGCLERIGLYLNRGPSMGVCRCLICLAMPLSCPIRFPGSVLRFGRYLSITR